MDYLVGQINEKKRKNEKGEFRTFAWIFERREVLLYNIKPEGGE